MTTIRVWYLFHGRFPSDKAASLWVRKTVEGLTEAGANVRLVAFRVKGLPFSMSAIIFALYALFYLCRHATRKSDSVFSNEPLAMLLLSFFFPNCLYELHVFPTHKMWFFRILLRRMRGIVAINRYLAQETTRVFTIDPNRISVAPSGVAIEEFDIAVSKEEARKRLNLPLNKKIVLYTGHLYDWKGVDTLGRAAEFLLDTLAIFVGGNPDDVEKFKEKYRAINNIQILGHKPHTEIPLWQKAADVLVLPNTATKKISRLYTSPMKLFEYMVSGRPVVASRVSSIEEILSDEMAVLVEPDNPKALARGIERALAHGEPLAQAARREVEQYSWKRRAERILSHIRSLT